MDNTHSITHRMPIYHPHDAGLRAISISGGRWQVQGQKRLLEGESASRTFDPWMNVGPPVDTPPNWRCSFSGV